MLRNERPLATIWQYNKAHQQSRFYMRVVTHEPFCWRPLDLFAYWWRFAKHMRQLLLIHPERVRAKKHANSCFDIGQCPFGRIHKIYNKTVHKRKQFCSFAVDLIPLTILTVATPAVFGRNLLFFLAESYCPACNMHNKLVHQIPNYWLIQRAALVPL